MNSDGTIDFNKLEQNLFKAVEQDARYQRENAAKFRAVEQNVGSYEEFKDIVAASHLRPLDKNDREGKLLRTFLFDLKSTLCNCMENIERFTPLYTIAFAILNSIYIFIYIYIYII